MPKFSMTSRTRLETCHPDLITLFNEVVKSFDCSILQGHRTEEVQNQAFDEGRSKVRWPSSYHNTIPSLATDCIPYPCPDWNNKIDFAFFGGYVLGVAQKLLDAGLMTHKVTYGGDFDRDQKVSDGWFDGVHFQLVVPSIGAKL